MEEHLTKFFEGVVGVVEANSFERMMLWKENQDIGKRTWVENNSGYGVTVGEVAGDPVFLSVLTAQVDGHKLLFIDPTSQVVDHRLVRKWLDKNLPQSAFRADGLLNITDAMNFANIFPYAPAPAAVEAA